jgi:hypothetical protein
MNEYQEMCYQAAQGKMLVADYIALVLAGKIPATPAHYEACRKIDKGDTK